MIISLDDSRIRTLKRVRAVLKDTLALDFAPATDAQSRCDWVTSALRRFYYPALQRGRSGCAGRCRTRMRSAFRASGGRGA